MSKISFFILFSSFLMICSVQGDFTPNEVRLGVLKHDVKVELTHRYEKGYDINLEALWKTPDYKFFSYIFSPRPHVGASINTDKGTNQFYLGLTWRLDFLKYLFIEATFGGEVHSGNLKTKSANKQSLGSRFLFRESISLGVQFLERQSISVMLDHASNAGISKPNPGLTSLGLRYGYRF